MKSSQAYARRSFQEGGFFIRSSRVVLVSVVLQLCEQVASVEEGLAHQIKSYILNHCSWSHGTIGSGEVVIAINQGSNLHTAVVFCICERFIVYSCSGFPVRSILNVLRTHISLTMLRILTKEHL